MDNEVEQILHEGTISDVDPGVDREPSPASVDPVAIAKLATGFLSNFEPCLEAIKMNLNELTIKQSSMIVLLADEGNSLQSEKFVELAQMHSKIELYNAKLLGIKKDMHQTAEKIALLKKRSLWLQSQKEKEALQQESQRELQLQREQELIAKPTTTVNNSSSSST